MQLAASSYVIIPANDTTLIENGDSIVIYGYDFSDTTAGHTVTFEDGDGTNSFAIQSSTGGLLGHQSSIPWLADKGLQITTTTNTTGIVFYRKTGV